MDRRLKQSDMSGKLSPNLIDSSLMRLTLLMAPMALRARPEQVFSAEFSGEHDFHFQRQSDSKLNDFLDKNRDRNQKIIPLSQH